MLAVPSDLKHQLLIESSKAWRKVRTSGAVPNSVHSILCLRHMKWDTWQTSYVIDQQAAGVLPDYNPHPAYDQLHPACVVLGKLDLWTFFICF